MEGWNEKEGILRWKGWKEEVNTEEQMWLWICRRGWEASDSVKKKRFVTEENERKNEWKEIDYKNA